jgi:hypothetical protein
MPVISPKALAIVLLSYSWVVIVSDTTEISVTPLALSLAAASMNHFISAACCSLDRVEGWNSLSIHFFAVASAPVAAGAAALAGAAAVAAGSSFLPQAASINAAAPTAVSVNIESERFILGLL